VTISDSQGLGTAPIVGFAASGGLASSGWPHQPPCNAPGWFALDGASIYAASVALIGTVAQRRGAAPLHYDIPYEEAVIAAITPWTRTLHAYGRDAVGQGTITARMGPGGFPIYPTQDGYIRVIIATPRHWDAFTDMLNQPEELLSEPWTDPLFRRENVDVMQVICAEFTKHYSTAELFHKGQKLGLTITPVATLNDFHDDSHIKSRGLFIDIDDPDFGTLEIMRPPTVFGDASLQCPITPAPALGQHQQLAAEIAAGPLPEVTEDERVDPRMPLEGLRVLDLGVGAVVPEAAAMLAAFGAEVIKVESRVYPDFLRRNGMDGPDDIDASPTFNQLNLGVKSIAVNMNETRGRELVKALVPSCDIVMENMRGGVVAKWGLDYEGAKSLREDLVYLSSQGLGSGPYDGYQTFGPNLQTFSGVTGQWAHPDDPYPVGTTLNHPDHMAGKQALVPVLAALLRRDRTGAGTFIEAAQVEGAAYLIGTRFLEQAFTDSDLPPLGNLQRTMAPHGVFPCQGEDRWIALSAETDEQWRTLCALIGAFTAPLAEVTDELFTAEGRAHHVDLINEWLSAWSSGYAVEDAERLLKQAGIPASRVIIGDELAANAKLHDNGFFPELPHARMGAKNYTGMPVIAVGCGRIAVGSPPLLGEHTHEVLAELGEPNLQDLQAARIIGF
jgi:crotonobetainyl-CoA:carnitine CoA-transferase CaiB-like acyl-CoA transferase